MPPPQGSPIDGPALYREAMEIIVAQHTMTDLQAATYMATIPRARRLPLMMALANVTVALAEMIAEVGDGQLSVDTILQGLGQRAAALRVPPQPPVEPLTRPRTDDRPAG